MSFKTIGLGVLLATVPATAFAVDLAVEVSAAQIQARLGSRNTRNIDVIHNFMQHSLNCLVGPKGEGFDEKAGNPCATTGNGVIPDSTDAAKTVQYRAAADKLKTGLATADPQEALKIALDAADTIAATQD